MLELSKTILKRFSFDKELFRKELKKAKNWVKPNEALLLKVWCLAQFGSSYKDVILEVFDAN